MIDDNILLKGILEQQADKIIKKFFEEADYQGYLKAWYELIQSTNKMIQDTAPWKLIKEKPQEGEKILQTAIWLIHKLNLLGSFFFINSFEKINNIFEFEKFDNSKNFEGFLPALYKDNFTIKAKPEIVFKKLDE